MSLNLEAMYTKMAGIGVDLDGQNALKSDSLIVENEITKPLNEAIWSGELEFGQVAASLIKEINSTHPDYDLPFLSHRIHTLLSIKNEPQPYHPLTSVYFRNVASSFIGDKQDLSIFGHELRDHDQILKLKIISLAGNKELLESAFSNAPLPEILRKDIKNVPEEIAKILVNRPDEVMQMLKLMTSDALSAIDDLSITPIYTDTKNAEDFISSSKSENRVTVFTMTSLLQAYSLLVGSQGMPSGVLLKGDKNYLAGLYKDTLNSFMANDWPEILEKVPVVTSGHGRSKFWLSNDILDHLTIQKKGEEIDVCHVGGGKYEPIDTFLRINAVGGKIGKINNLDMHDPEELNALKQALSFGKKGATGSGPYMASGTDEIYRLLVDLRKVDLRDTKFDPWVNFDRNFDLIVSTHVLYPHLKPIQQLNNLNNMVYMVKPGGIIVVGGWYAGHSPGVGNVAVQVNEKSVKVLEVRIQDVGKDGIMGTNMHLFSTFPNSEAKPLTDIGNYSPAKRSDHFKDLPKVPRSRLLLGDT